MRVRIIVLFLGIEVAVWSIKIVSLRIEVILLIKIIGRVVVWYLRIKVVDVGRRIVEIVYKLIAKVIWISIEGYIAASAVVCFIEGIALIGIDVDS